MSVEEDDARDRLLFHLENQTGFWFALVVSEDAGPRNRLRDVAAQWCKEHGRAFFLHEPLPEDLVQLAVSLASSEEAGLHWICTDGLKGVIESWDAGATRMLMAMNERREAYRKRLCGGIVIAGRPSLKRIVRETAPDLFSIRAFVAEPGEQSGNSPSNIPEWKSPAPLIPTFTDDTVDPDLALRRLSWLSSGAEEMTPEWIRAELAAILSLFNAERYEELERHANEILSRLQRDVGADSPVTRLFCGFVNFVRSWSALYNDKDAAKAGRLLEGVEKLLTWRSSDGEGPVIDPATRAAMLFGLGVLRFDLGDTSGAKAALREYVATFPEPRDLPIEAQLQLSMAHWQLATLLVNEGLLDAAEEGYRTALRIDEDNSSRRPEDVRWQFETLRARTALGNLQLRRYDPVNGDLAPITSAHSTLLSAAYIGRRLLHVEPANESLNKLLEWLYRQLATLLSFHEIYSKDIDEIRENALAFLLRNFGQNPEDAELGWLLARCYLHRAKLLEAGDPAGAMESAQHALDLGHRLPVSTPENADLKQKIETLRSFVGNSSGKKKPRKH